MVLSDKDVLVYTFVFFQLFEDGIAILLEAIAPDEKLVNDFVVVSLYLRKSLVSEALYFLIIFDVDLLFYLGFVEFLMHLMFLIKFGKFLFTISSICFSAPFSFSFWNFHDELAGMLDLVHRSLRLCSFYFFLSIHQII